MISNSIQELFDGTLGDEQTAELLHSLSVSPERRTDFRRHMALQGAMQRDRAASALTSEEDDAIWGALAGLGAAGTVGSGTVNYLGGFAKAFTVILVGVVGYLLGSTSSVDIFGGGEPGKTIMAEHQVTDQQRPGAVTAPPAPWYTGPGIAAPSPAPPDIAAAPTGTATPKVIYKEKVVYRDRPSRTAASLPAASGTADGNGVHSGSEGLTIAAAEQQPSNMASSIDTNGSTMPPLQSPSITSNRSQPSNLQPNDSGAIKAQAAAEQKNQVIDPAMAFRRSPEQAPLDDENGTAASLWTNGLEVSYGEYLGLLYGTLLSDDLANADPHYFSRHFDLTYRFGDGRFGFGARLGYGTFSRVSLYLDYNVRTDIDGGINRIDSMYRVRVQPQKQALLEFLVNYRLPIADRLGIGVEASWGQSPVHMKAGGSMMLNWLLTDHIGLHIGGGLNRYWYSYIGEQRETILRNGGDGTSMSDKVSDSYTGTSFEGRYGIFYHF